MLQNNWSYSDQRPGTLTLRPSFHMQYNPAVLNDEWYEFFQAEPKDYDITKIDTKKKNWFLSTYKDLGWLPTQPGISETKDAMKDVHFSSCERLPRPPMVNMGNFKKTILGEKDCIEKSLPLKKLMERHAVFSEKNASVSKTDFTYPHRLGKTPKDIRDWAPRDLPWLLYRKCQSQFTDIDDHRHGQVQTWAEESGIYCDNYLKKEYNPHINPILGR